MPSNILLSPEKTYEKLHAVVSLGCRWAGTKGEQQARDYIFNKFTEYGLDDVHLEKFSYLSYKPTNCNLNITSPYRDEIPCEPMEYSPNKEIEGELVYVGAGSKEEFKQVEELGVTIEGKILLFSRDYYLRDVINYAEENQGAGIIAISDITYPGMLDPPDLIRKFPTGNWPVPLSPPFDVVMGKIPGVTISLSSGEKLLRLLCNNKVFVKINHEGVYAEKESFNVIGEISGEELPDEKVLVGAHYDCQLVEQGACDDATGVAGVLELARVFRETKPKRTMIFSTFGCEEIGLWGSSAYVKKHYADVERNYKFMANLDSVSTSLTPINYIFGTLEAQELAKKAAYDLGWNVNKIWDLEDYRRIDAVPFMDAGVSSVWIGSGGSANPFYHTDFDRIEYIDTKKLTNTLNVTGLCLSRAANIESTSG